MVRELFEMARSKKAAKASDGQGTLFAFLDKAEPQARKRPALVTDEPDHCKTLKMSSQSLVVDRNINLPRLLTTPNDTLSIAPALANHRLETRKNLIRPKQLTDSEQHARNDYVFLSSSPPLPVPKLEDIPAKPPGLTSNPPLLPLIRPATTMHTTTLSIAQNSAGSKKTLGVKRSMNGWSGGKGQAFRPPTMKRA